MIVSYKKRSQKEIAQIVSEYQKGLTQADLAEKYQVSEDSIYRILKSASGTEDARAKKRSDQVKKLEKKLKARDEEIKLLKAALKKY
jgi:Mor family transcriptional regulator